MKNIKRYISIWFLFAANEFQQQFSTRVSALLFFAGKVFRFVGFLVLLLVLQHSTKTLAGYSFTAIIVFFFSFNFVDLLSQMLFRGVYMFSAKVRTGEFDYYLAKPVNVLFRSLASNPDFNDILTFIPLVIFFFWYLNKFNLHPTLLQFGLFSLLIFSGLMIAMAFYIFVICLGILTTEVDNTIMVYRGLSEVGRFPVEVYREPIRWLVTFVVPIGIMMGFPAHVLLGEPPLNYVLVSLTAAVGFVSIALVAWHFSLRQYTSASS